MHNEYFDLDQWRGTIHFPPLTTFGIDEARRVAGHLANQVFVEGYPEFVRRVTDPGRFWELGPVEVIPTIGGTKEDSREPCAPVLVGVSKGTRGPLSLKSVMGGVLARLVECLDSVSAVILVADTWNSPEFQAAYLKQVIAHMKRGVAFLLLLVGPDGHSLSQIHVDPGTAF